MTRRPSTRRWLIGVAAAALALCFAAPALAHAFGQRYDLPVPLLLYLVGAGAAVALSFVVIGAFIGGGAARRDYRRFNLLAHPLGRFLAGDFVGAAVKAIVAALFMLVVAAGFLGDQHPMRNIAPVMVWIIGWVGLVYVQAFVGDLWTLINPWRTLFACAEALYCRLTGGRDLGLGLPYPARWQAWPAVALFAAFAWGELVFPEPAKPANIAWMLVGYSAITWVGMAAFGRERWLKHGEVFSVLFAMLARFAPLEARVTRPEICARCGLGCLDHDHVCINCPTCYSLANNAERQWALRPFAVGLLRNDTVSTSVMALVLLFLSVVLYDGLMVTPGFRQLEDVVLSAVSATGEGWQMVGRTFGLVGFWLLFLAAYLVTCRLMVALVDNRLGAMETARRFAPTLVPIAIAYHLAHYLTFLLVQGQYVIPLASDPFGSGWNVFGSAGYRIDIAIVGAKFTWYAVVAAIVIGHVIAVYLAHRQATATFVEHRPAMLSQYPLTALMVAFTVISLSILAEPIINQPAAASAATPGRAIVQVPADALLPDAAAGRLRPVGSGKQAMVALRYGAMTSLFHDGTKTEVADLLYAYAFVYRWGIKGAYGRRYDPEVDRTTALLRVQLAGIRPAGVDNASKSFRVGETTFVRELLLFDVYLRDASANPGRAAVVAPPWSPVPWHVMALMEEAVSSGMAAFSEAEARRLGLPWLDLVRDKALTEKLKPLVEKFAADGFVPEPLAGLVTAEQAKARWRALKAFGDKHGYFLVTNGPYFLKSWTKEATELTVFRDMSYPLGVGSYNAYATPRRAFISAIENDAMGLKVTAEMETIETYGREYKVVRRPLKEVHRTALKGGKLDCVYLVLDGDGRVQRAGVGVLQGDGTIAIALDGNLPSGDYRVLVTLYLNGNTVNADIRSVPFRAQDGK
ncbi:MAG: hypothetical protein HYS64_05025 [Rhodospirillales bacterium]|nr:hypothetical protein [Rhodospirillales bacterium]